MANIQKRTLDDGTTTYRVQIRLKGHPAQTASFSRLTDAKRWATQTEAAIREGRHFKAIEAKRHTCAELLERYIRDILPRKPRSAPRQQKQLEWWKAALGPYLLVDLTPAMLAGCRDKLLSGQTVKGERRTPATVNRYLAALSHAFTIAVKEWGWLDENPMRKVTRLKEPRGRVRFLSDVERERLLAACRGSRNPVLYPVVVLALSTGMRYTELMTLTWNDVDLERGQVVLNETKNDERRAVPITGAALELLKGLEGRDREDTALLFPGEKDPRKPREMQNAWKRALEVAQIKDFHFHDLRHSAASYLAMSGASLAEIAEVLGHKTLQMVKRYAHISSAHTASIVARMNSKFIGAEVVVGS